MGLFSSSSSYECLDHCKGTAGCNYFTQYETDAVCFAFRDCPTFAEGFCSQCISGEVGCSSFQCDLQGQCVGSLVGIETGVGVSRDCAALCRDAGPGCRWWSFDAKTEICGLYSDCEEINSSCGTCTTGEADCEGQGPGEPPSLGKVCAAFFS